MIEAEPFTHGMQGIAAAVRMAWKAEELGVYFDALQDRTDVAEWTEFVRWANAAGRWNVLPKLVELQDALREFRGERPLLAEATEAYERVLQAGVYTAEGGTSWTYRGVREACGDAAGLAFLEAGGSAAFSSTWNEDKRRERFCAGYAEAVRDDPESKLLPSGPARLLQAPGQDPSREEARALVQRIAARAGR